MNKRRALVYSSLIFITAAVAGYFCVVYCAGSQSAEERKALTEITVIGGGFAGLVALALALLTYFFFLKSEKLKLHANGLTEANLRLEEEIIRRRAAEEKSAGLAREWARTFDSIPDLISIHSNDFRIIRVNQAAADFFGMKNEEITGKYCYEIFHGTKEPIAECPHAITLQTAKAATIELCDISKAGHSMVSTSPIFNNQHGVIGTVHIVKDTTELKKLEAQLRHAQHMEAVGRLAGGVAHEFNNILAAIINYGHLLKDTSSGDSEHINFTAKILALAEKASQISQNLLIFSRRQRLELKPSDLNMIMKRAGQPVRGSTGDDIEFVSLPCENALVVLADERSMEQCIFNLARNAMEVMSGGGTLTIRTEVFEMDGTFIKSCGFGAPGLYALLSVTDTGPGIDNKNGRRIFEPFFTTKEAGKGAGLGLSIVYGITKQHNGYIDVESGPVNGTTFKLYFPLINEETQLSNTKEVIGNG